MRKYRIFRPYIPIKEKTNIQTIYLIRRFIVATLIFRQRLTKSTTENHKWVDVKGKAFVVPETNNSKPRLYVNLSANNPLVLWSYFHPFRHGNAVTLFQFPFH